jgi:hypothetical protein
VRKKILLVINVLFVLAACLRAQDDPNAVISKKLFSKLTTSLTSTPNEAKPGQTFLVLFNPGVFVDPNLSEAIQEDRQTIAQILNIVPNASWIVAGDSAKRVDQIYGLALAHSEWGYVDPTANETQHLNGARALLYVNGDPAKGRSPALEKYILYQSKYYDAVNALESARSDVANGKAHQISNALQTKKRQAQQDWETLGQRNIVERALQYEYSLTSTTANWFFKLRQQFDTFQETIGGVGEFYTTSSYPRYNQWFSDEGWQKITFTQEDIEKQTESNHVSYGGGGSGGWGLWSVSASAHHTHDDQRLESSVTNLAISMEVKRVVIVRPWLNQLLFESPRWRYRADAPFDPSVPISDGHASASSLPKGTMPLYPTAVLIARKVQITGAQGNELQTFVHDHTSASGSVGYGPFSVSGNYEEDHTRGRVSVHNVNNGIEISEPQIIGFFCLVLGPTPNPTSDPHVKWLSDPPANPAPAPAQ